MEDNALPVWNLETLYRGSNRQKYDQLKGQIRTITEDFTTAVQNDKLRAAAPADWLKESIHLYNRLNDLYEEAEAFAHMQYSSNTSDAVALKDLNDIEALQLPFESSLVLFRENLSQLPVALDELIGKNENLAEFSFFLQEQLFLQTHSMSQEEEELAADLNRSGGNAWARLFESVSSNASIEWDEKSGEKKTVTELRALAADPDRSIRRKAYVKELAAVEQNEVPIAYALNGVKGFTISLNTRRGYTSTLEKSVHQARITEKTLDALIQVLEESRPVFHAYLSGKASLLGLEKLSFYDLFAPLGESSAEWSFDDARHFILTHFNAFSRELGDFASAAFENEWIDAKPRRGKVGGAYCISLPIQGESRILANYSGRFGDIKTVAHELGHAFHHEVLKDAPHCHRDYPMTLAETASIFAESIVLEGALKNAAKPDKLPIIEMFLKDATQVIIDILSRFKFEAALMKRRSDGEISPEELKELMRDAQRFAYGDALNHEELHPYMWAVKPHYYRPELSYYNFPYAFGKLFGLGLYAKYVEEGEAFVPVYRELLKNTGRMSAVELANSAGFDIEDPEFWRRGIHFIEKRVEEFISFVE